MRLIGAAFTLFLLAVAFAIVGDAQGKPGTSVGALAAAPRGQERPDGRTIFRFDTFGDEQLWTGVLRMHDVFETVSPSTALGVGLKVDVDALPSDLVALLRANQVNLMDPAVTLALIRLNAVVGVQGTVTDSGHLQQIGITCALCHSTVDNSLTRGIGKRLDGWQNSDLNVGAILALSPVFDDALKTEFRTWGPGRYDPRHHIFNGMNIVPINTPSLPIVIPPIYGLKGVGFETVTADGPISYWNSYVGVTQMGGKGTFTDDRIRVSVTQTPDLVTPKLEALLDYQLRLKAPETATDSFDRDAARRGRDLFRREARCVSCHQGSVLTDVLSGPDRRVPLLHDPAEVGQDARYAERTATRKYRTTPREGLFQEDKDLASAYRRLLRAGFRTGEIVRVLKKFAANPELLDNFEPPEETED